MGIKEKILAAEKELGHPLTNLPTQLIIEPTRVTLETGKDSLRLQAQIKRFGNIDVTDQRLQWFVVSNDPTLVELRPDPDGITCQVIPRNTHDDNRRIIVSARTSSGLEAATVLQIAPAQLEPPAFIEKPRITLSSVSGTLTVDYRLDMSYEDQSLVTWYRCCNTQGQ